MENLLTKKIAASEAAITGLRSQVRILEGRIGEEEVRIKLLKELLSEVNATINEVSVPNLDETEVVHVATHGILEEPDKANISRYWRERLLDFFKGRDFFTVEDVRRSFGIPADDAKTNNHIHTRLVEFKKKGIIVRERLGRYSIAKPQGPTNGQAQADLLEEVETPV